MSDEKLFVSRSQAERIKAAGFNSKTQFGYGVSGEVEHGVFHYAKGKNWNGDKDFASCPSIATALHWARSHRGLDFSVTTRTGKRYLATLYLPSYKVKIRGGDYKSVTSALLDTVLDELEKVEMQ